MLPRPRPSALNTASVLPILLLLAGCGDRGGVFAPTRISPGAARNAGAAALVSIRAGDPSTAPRLGIYRRIWPHEDGRSWSYAYVSRTWDGEPAQFHPTPEGIPTLTLDDAARLLESDPDPSGSITSTGAYGLRFNGQVTTRSGVTAQHLEETLTEGAASAAAATPVRAGRGFLALLRRARPDLAAKLEAAGAAPAGLADATSLTHPTLLHGYAWEQNDNWIGTYGDLNQQVAWIFLTSDLGAGSEFRLQLVPDLADDVFLNARVLGPRRVTTDAGVFQRAFGVLYLVDFGVSLATDRNGNPLGYFRAYLFGTIDYVAGVGPVRSYERFHLVVDGEPDLPVEDIALKLTASEAGASALASR